jgi:hypothetical protein
VASIAQAYGEITPYFASSAATPQRFNALVLGAFAPADSKWSRDLYIQDCLDIPPTIYALAQPAASRKRLLQSCRDNASRIVAAAPTLSNAWLVIATTSAALRDYPAMRQALAMSRQTAPNLQWLADRRTRLVEEYPLEIDDANRAGYENDVAVLASGDVGAKSLARRYAQLPQLRETYTRIIETLPAERQRTFLALVTNTDGP